MPSRPAAGAFPAEGTTPSTPAHPASGPRALPWWPCVLAALLTAGIAFWGITAPEYWHDEAATVSAVTRPLPELLRMLGNVDAVHALYYVVLHPWAGVFGTSELALRTPSALALTIMAVPLTRLGMLWAWQITGSAPRAVMAGAFTAVLTATLPGLSWAGQKARGYALGMLAAVAAMWCFQRFLTGGRRTDLVYFGLAQAAAVGFTMWLCGPMLTSHVDGS